MVIHESTLLVCLIFSVLFACALSLGIGCCGIPLLFGVNLACDTKFGTFDFTYQNELWGIDIIPFFSVPSMTRTNVPPWYDVAQDRNASFVFVNTIVIWSYLTSCTTTEGYFFPATTTFS
jgi:hypothetical protein